MPAPRGVPKIEVTFDLDANGIMNVSAKDQATGRDQKITITASSGLNEQDIQRMVKEAQEHESEDKRRREEIETRNKADAMVYQMEKMVTENKDKLPAGDVTTLEERIKELKDAVAKEDYAAMKTAMESLQQASYRAAEAMYRSPAPAPDQGAPPRRAARQGDLPLGRQRQGRDRRGVRRNEVVGCSCAGCGTRCNRAVAEETIAR